MTNTETPATLPACDDCGAPAGTPCDNTYCYGSLGAEDSDR